jgi:hypothetical protein
VNIVAQIGADTGTKLGHRHGHDVEPLKHEGQDLGDMADHDLQIRIAIEYARE